MSTILSLDADEIPGASDQGAPQIITLISKEGHRLQVARQALMASELCKTTLEGDKDASEIPLYHIEGAIVQKVIEYLTYHLKIPPRKIDKPLLSNNMRDLVDKWDVNFIDNGETAGSNTAAAAAATAAAANAQQAAAAAAAASAAAPTTPGGTASLPSSSSTTSAASAAIAAAAASAPSAASQEILFKLLLAANYLNIKSLLSLTCAKVASLMKGKTPDQIRAVFNIRNDYTQAEEEEVRKKYKDLIG